MSVQKNPQQNQQDEADQNIEIRTVSPSYVDNLRVALAIANAEHAREEAAAHRSS